jgi:hypothetical protein
VIEAKGDAHGAEVEAAIGMKVFGCLEIDSQRRRVSFDDLQHPLDNIVRRHKHNDDMLILTVCL